MTFPTYFTPHSSVISSISNARNAVVTTTTDHGFISGMVITIYLPKTGNFGMIQFPEVYSSVIFVGPPNMFAIFINTTDFDPFVLDPKQSAQALFAGTFFYGIPPIDQEATRNNGKILPEYSWTNTTFPWINNPNYVAP